MMSETSTSNPSDFTGQDQLAALQLAFIGGPRDGQAVRINAAKCTIGSAEQATLRLVCKGVHPTHCMILRGESGTIVKRMSEDTLLNDSSFEEAELNENDVLSIGPLRFRVVTSDRTETPSPAAAVAAVSTESNSEAEELRQRCDELMSQLEALQQERAVDSQIVEQPVAEQPSSTADAELEQRLRELEAARERDQQELEAKHAEIEAAQVEAQQARDALNAMQQQQQDEAATDVASALGVEAIQQPEPTPEPEEYGQNYPQASRTMAMEMLNRLREESPAVPNASASTKDVTFTQPFDQVDQGSSALETPSESTFEQSAYDQSQEQSPYESAAQGQDEPASLFGQPESAPSDYEQSSDEQNAYEQQTPVEEQPYQAAETASPYSESDESAAAAVSPYSESDYGQTAEEPESQFENYETTSSSSTSEAASTEEELTFSEPEDAAPIDTASILAKFGHTLEDDDDAVTGTISFDDLNSRAEASSSSSSSSYDEVGEEQPVSGGGGDEDESIDDYMTQLMARVGGGDYEAPKPSSSSSSSAPAETIMLDSNAKKEAKPKPNAAPLDPSEFVPRAVAPEASSNLRALRAVANTSARSAIDRHQRRSFDNKAYICWFIAIASAIVCFSMAFFAKNLISLPTLVSMVSLLISFFATINALAFSAKAKIGARSTQKKLAANIEEASVPRLPAN